MKLARTLALALGLLGAVAAGCGDASSSGDARIDALFGEVPYGNLNRATARAILDTPPELDRPFHLVELVRHRERAVYADGRASDLSGAEADALHDSLALPILAEVGAEAIYVADVELLLITRDGAAWDRIAVVRYPSRAAFVATLERDELRAARVHRDAGVERAIALVTEALAPPIPDALRRVDLAALPHPATATDPPVTVVHLLDFNEIARFADGRETTLTGREAMDLYEQARAAQALPLGVRPGIRLTVLAELVGDGRPWEELRINNFPSRAAFRVLVSAESLGGAGIENREAAIADTYALLAAPIVNRVGYLPPE